MRFVLRSKIHQATVTEAQLHYIGSITVDEDLMDKAGFWANEQIQVVSNTSGANFITYCLPGPRGSGVLCMNGAAAHYVRVGEEVIIMGFELTDRPIPAQAILVDAQNAFVRYL
jgi:aspartate 1-decarboxylase